MRRPVPLQQHVSEARPAQPPPARPRGRGGRGPGGRADAPLTLAGRPSPRSSARGVGASRGLGAPGGRPLAPLGAVWALLGGWGRRAGRGRLSGDGAGGAGPALTPGSGPRSPPGGGRSGEVTLYPRGVVLWPRPGPGGFARLVTVAAHPGGGIAAGGPGHARFFILVKSRTVTCRYHFFFKFYYESFYQLKKLIEFYREHV